MIFHAFTCFCFYYFFTTVFLDCLRSVRYAQSSLVGWSECARDKDQFMLLCSDGATGRHSTDFVCESMSDLPELIMLPVATSGMLPITSHFGVALTHQRTEVWEFFMDVQEAVDLVAPFGKAKAQEAAEAQGLAL